MNSQLENITKKAAAFAARKHSEINQVRKYTGRPYIEHPADVARIVSEVCTDPVLIAACWLHDTIEDTKTTNAEILSEFGEKVAGLVYGLTDLSKPDDGNRKIRKAIDRAKLRACCNGVKTIKIADLIHNFESIVEHDPKFAKVFVDEMRLLLPALVGGDRILWHRAAKLVTNFNN